MKIIKLLTRHQTACGGMASFKYEKNKKRFAAKGKIALCTHTALHAYIHPAQARLFFKGHVQSCQNIMWMASTTGKDQVSNGMKLGVKDITIKKCLGPLTKREIPEYKKAELALELQLVEERNREWRKELTRRLERVKKFKRAGSESTSCRGYGRNLSPKKLQAIYNRVFEGTKWDWK